MGEGLKVYGFSISPFTRKVLMTLNLKGIKYDYVEEDLNNKSSDLLRYNPVHKATPVLLHNGNPLPESLIIVEYIDETWTNKPLMPVDPYDRAMARFWANFIDTKLVPSIKVAVLKECEEHEHEKKIEEANQWVKTIEDVLGNKKFFGGEKIGYLDIAAIWLVGWVPPMQEAAGWQLINKEKYPNLSAWTEEMLSHDIVKENLPHRDPLHAYYVWRLSGFKPELTPK
ncbi:putative glutathione S-transferase [Drosera capensis]